MSADRAPLVSSPLRQLAREVSCTSCGGRHRKPNKAKSGETEIVAHVGRMQSGYHNKASSCGSWEHSLPELGATSVAAAESSPLRPVGLLSGTQAASAFTKPLPLLEPAGPCPSLTRPGLCSPIPPLPPYPVPLPVTAARCDLGCDPGH